jgi:ABC-2 type transport system permease protein
MRSRISCFNTTLYGKNMARFWPIWVLYGIVWLFAMPISILLQSGRYQGDPETRREIVGWFADRTVLELAGDFAVGLTFCFGILVAMAVFSYLYQGRSASMIHALPVRREGLFLTNFLAGYSFFLVPHGVIFLLTLLAEGVGGYVNLNALFVWFLAVSFLSFFFYSFAAFCAMFTGHLLALPVFYGVLNFLASVVEFLLDNVLGNYVYGYLSLQWLNNLARWLTPAINLSGLLRVRDDSVYTAAGVVAQQKFTLVGLQYAMLYAAVGLILAVAALLVYRRRQLESAGDVVSVAAVRPVFRYGVAFCAALTFGSFLYSMFAYLLPDSAWSLLILMLLCGAAGYFAAEMFLQKSFRVFRRWKGCAAFLLCLSALMAAMELDLTGFERRVPQAEGIQSVRVEGISSAPYDAADRAVLELTDPADISLVVQIHQTLVDHKEEIEAGRYPTSYDTEYNGEYRGWSNNELTLTYYLENGAQISRRYRDVVVLSQELDQPGSLSALLQELINRPDAIQQAYGLEQVQDQDVLSAYIQVYDRAQRDWEYVEVDGIENRLRLYQAIQADLKEGGLGERFLLEDQARAERTYRNDIELEYLVPDQKGERSYTNSMRITLQTGAVHTLKVLEEMGISTGDQLITNWQWDRWDEEQNSSLEETGGVVDLPSVATVQ